MLKLTYTENGFYLERLTLPLEDWISTRVLLSLRAGAAISIEPSTASFLLAADLPNLGDLEKLEGENGDVIELSPSDAEYVEVSLNGTWVAPTPDSEEGIFVSVMSERAEFFLYKLWQESQNFAYRQ